MNTDNVSVTAGPAERGAYLSLGIDTRNAGPAGLLIALASAFACTFKVPFRQDARTLLLIAALLCREEMFRLCTSLVQSVRSGVLGVLGVLAAVSCLLLLRTATMTPPREGQQQPSAPFLPPLIFPCYTTHTRFFPSKHSFTYSYLLVGIPIGWRHDSGTLSCDPATLRPQGWFSVYNEDYLARGSHTGGLRGKLDDYLRQNDISLNELPYAYLVTAPRFLGWSFNPVSFWYLYDGDRRLSAMILEVNNTFDERRMYLLKPGHSAGAARFRERWQKDFHVSPFNDRTGEYSIVASDPFQGLDWTVESPSRVSIDNNITLSSPPPDAKPKLIARIYSTSPHINPASLTLVQLASFMAQWCWTGFLTNVRILWEARILWAKKKLQVFYRPEVNLGSIGRQEQKDETVLEEYFCRWLESTAESNDLRLAYMSAAGLHRGQRIVLGETSALPDSTRPDCSIKVEVLTPEWYAELARARDFRLTFKQRCSAAVEGEQMLSISGARADMFATLLDEIILSRAGETHRRHTGFQTRLISHLSSGVALYWSMLFAISGTQAGSSKGNEDIVVSFRDLVEHMTGTESDPTQTRGAMADYDTAALMVLLADRVALGYTSLLRAYGRVVRYGVIFLFARYLAFLVSLSDESTV